MWLSYDGEQCSDMWNRDLKGLALGPGLLTVHPGRCLWGLELVVENKHS